MKSALLFAFILCDMLYHNTHAVKLPSYIEVCKRSDPNVNACAITNSKKVLASLLHGDKTIKLPSLDPIFVKKAVVNGGNLKLTLNDATVHGMKNSEVKHIEISSDGLKWKFNLLIPTFTILSNYEVDGKILILPITGKGAGNFTFIDMNYDFIMEFELYDKDGSKYAKIKSSNLTYKISKLHIQMENLFGGDSTLAGEMLKFLNENWVDVNEELSPAISEVMNSIATALFNNLFVNVPFDEILPP